MIRTDEVKAEFDLLLEQVMDACESRSGYRNDLKKICVGRIRVRIHALIDALEPLAKSGVGHDDQCHYGVVDEEDCGRCGPILRARRALVEPR